MRKVPDKKSANLLASPDELAGELRSFRRAAKALSSSHPRLIDQYPKQWVAVYSGKVTAHAKTFDAVIEELARKGIPRGRTIIRYIDRNQRTMILAFPSNVNR